MYEIKVKPSTRKKLAKFPKAILDKLNVEIPLLSSNPFLGKKLSGKLKGFYSWRVWPYRIVYTIVRKELIVIIVDIDHRKNIYK